MLLNNLNLNLLRVFEAVYRSGSMTKAAQELNMTQSGVSQNIKNLEDLLELQLFDRVKHRPIPTDPAKQLFKQCSPMFEQLEQTLQGLTGRQSELKGEIGLGIPIEFGNSIVLPLLSKFLKEYPDVNLSIRYGLGPEINDGLISGALDFAIVDEYSFDSEIEIENLTQEELVLCANQEYEALITSTKKKDKKFFESLPYIAYTKNCPILSQWFKHHFRFGQLKYNTRATLLDVQGMARMIENGVGFGVLPLYIVERVFKTKKVVIVPGGTRPLYNHLSFAKVKRRSLSPQASALIEHLGKGLS